MVNSHQKLTKFYNRHIRLGPTEREQLAGYRDLNLKRLDTGLVLLGEDNQSKYRSPIQDCNQGSYAMHTLNQNLDNAYDIDVAIIFRREDLPASPLEARQRVEAAFRKAGGNFAREPEARTNAVTIWYAEGYHIDFAVYREYKNEFGVTVIEHAGPEWTPRNPTEFTDWFNTSVNRVSPAQLYGATVDEGQMRRIVRFLKAFARSREDWSLPGGMIISTLVAECYRADYQRDDIALYNTVCAIQDRLQTNLEVLNPVSPSQSLTCKAKYLNQVERFRDRLGEAKDQLRSAFTPNCTETEAAKSWHWFFQHPFWTDTTAKAATAGILEELAVGSTRVGKVRIRADLAMRSGGRLVSQYPSGSRVLPKDVWLRFSIVDPAVAPPYNVRWIVQNYGDEASEVADLSHRQFTDVAWERTAYKGRHTMTCELYRDGTVLARGQHVVRIS